MSLHGYSIFTNLCMRTPIHPRNKQPRPSSDLKPQCVFDAVKTKRPIKKKKRKKNPKTNPSSLLAKDHDNFYTLMHFYDSIPDYNDVGHLTEVEFNIRLDTLRQKQLELGFRTLCLTDDVNQATQLETERPMNSDILVRKGSAKSVRISSAESMHSPVQYLNNAEDNTSKYFRKNLHPTTVSPSPDRYSSKHMLTVPEPFEMMRREERKQSLEKRISAATPESRSSPVREKPFKATPVPITSKFPMYKEILKDQEHRSQLAKLEAAIELQSQMKPFSFDSGPSTRSRNCLTRSFSSPNLFTSDMVEEQKSVFKATPFPKKLFNNNFYNKTCEENYFRDLRKKIRAEAMAKMAKLPPSMAKREESLTSGSSKSTKKRRKKKKQPAAIKITPPSEYITTCQHPFQLQTEKRAKATRSCKHLMTSPTTENSRVTRPQTSSSTSYYSSMPDIPRSNLASTFRRESSRKKIEQLNTKPQLLDEMPKLTHFKRPKWHVEKMASWKALSYDPTHSENEATLLSIRRAEQRMRQEQYDIEMEIMRQRVKAAPLLLEGATTYGRRPVHKCSAETPINDGHKSRRSASSKTSYYSKATSGDQPFVHELDSVDQNFL